MMICGIYCRSYAGLGLYDTGLFLTCLPVDSIYVPERPAQNVMLGGGLTDLGGSFGRLAY